tara:strand:+ start:216 stop:1994 length:1779 start_codon:yes stop_codon:yes gene_type:complete
MAVYTRQSTFTDGDTIFAALLNNEYDQLAAAFNVSSGHTHDGSTAGDGGPISKLFSNAITLGTNVNADVVLTFDATSNDGVLSWMEDEDYFQFSDDILLSTDEKILFRDSAISINSSTDGRLNIAADTDIVVATTTFDVNANTDISGTLKVGSGATVSTILDEDNFATNSATALATQQSIKAYVDAVSASLTQQDLDFQGDSGGALDVDLDSESLTIAGGTLISTAGSGTTITINADASVLTDSNTKTLTNKTIDANGTGNSITNIEVADLASGVLDTALASVSGSDDTLASAKAIKSYVDTQVATVPTGDITEVTAGTGLTGGGTTGAVTVNVIGGTGITANANDIAIDGTVATLTGSQNLENKTLTSPVINTGVSGSAILDEDNFASDSDTKLATQQSIKAYIDSQPNALTLIDEDDMATDSATRPPSQQSVKAFVTSQVATANELSELTDTNITSAADGALLFYDTGTSKWIDNVVSGDITIADTGVATIAAGAVDNTMLAGSITAAKLAGSIGDSKLSTITTADKVSAAAVQVDGATDGTGITLATTDKLIVDDAGTTKYINASQLNTYMTGQGFVTDDPTALAIALG